MLDCFYAVGIMTMSNFHPHQKKIPLLENLAAVSISRNDTIRKMKKSNEIKIWWWWCAMLQTTLGIELPDGVPWLTINNVLTDCSAWALSIKELLWKRRVSLIIDFIFVLQRFFSPSLDFLLISASFWDKMTQNTWKTKTWRNWNSQNWSLQNIISQILRVPYASHSRAGR